MRVRATLTLDLDVKTPSEAAKVLEPLLTAVPAVEQFSWSIKGQEWFETRAERNGRIREKKARLARVSDY